MADEPKMLTMEEFQSEVSAQVEKTIRDLGLDKIDRKNAIFPTAEDPNGDGLQDLTKEQRVAKFLTAMVRGDEGTVKALSEGTAADGGYLVPNEFKASILAKLYKESVLRPRVTTIPLHRDKLDYPVEGNNVTVTWTPENTAFTESNPTFGNITLNTNKLTGLSKLSRELFSDSAIGLMDYLSTIWARAFKTEEERVIMAGDGSSKPRGIRIETLTSNAQAGANLAADDIVKLFYKLPVQYRNRATFILHNNVIALVRLLKDSQGRYIWTDGFADAAPTLMGRPVIEVNDIPTNLGGGTNESEIFFGDLSYYLLGDREEIGVETTTVGAGTFENHQVAFKIWERLDGRLGLTESFVKMTAVK